MPKKKKNVENVQDSVILHYQEANNELNSRITNKDRGFDVYDRIFRNFIDKAKWPFNARVPDGRGSTLIKRKTDRLLANRLQGTMIPTKTGTELGAKVSSELILHEWGQVDTKTDETMIARWRKIDMNARKYGAGFGLVVWRKTDIFDGSTIEPIENRNVLLQPGATSIDNSEWVQIRRYVTLNELKSVNDQAKAGDIYDKKVLSSLSERDYKSQDYASINKQVIGLSDSTKGTERIEIVTEYRRDRWITFIPKQGREGGCILRDISNPYKHGMIPIVRVVYDAIDDDIYGIPELENVLPLIKANWALISQYLEQAQIELMSPIMINPNQADIDTIKYETGARWLMNSPGKDVVKFDGGTTAMTQFQGVYGLITSLIMEGVGETGQDVSVLGANVNDKTATEVRDLSMLRTARDNANKAILSQAIGKMVYFWHKMNQQFIDNAKLIRITGKEALQYMMEKQLHGWSVSDEGLAFVSLFAEENNISFEEAYESMRVQGMLEKFATPIYPVEVSGQQLPKMTLDDNGRSGHLLVEKDDISGDFDYIVDIEAMGIPNDQTEVQARQLVSGLMLQTVPLIQQEGYRIKWKEFIEDLGEKAKLKNMEQYFDNVPQQMTMQQGMNGTQQEAMMNNNLPQQTNGQTGTDTQGAGIAG